MIVRVLAKTGGTVQDRGMMYKAVAQSVLMYGSESWGVVGEMLKVLERFNHRVARRITWMTEINGSVMEWEYPPVVAALESARLYPITEE